MNFSWENVKGRENSSTNVNNDKITVKPYRSYEFPTPSFQQGWICPKCGRVNAPWMGTCPCFTDKNPIHYDYKINFVN